MNGNLVFHLYFGNEKANKSENRSLDSARGALCNETILVLVGDWGRELFPFKCNPFLAYISGMPGPNRTKIESKLGGDGPFPTSYSTRIGVVWFGSYSRSNSEVSRIRHSRGGVPELRDNRFRLRAWRGPYHQNLSAQRLSVFELWVNLYCGGRGLNGGLRFTFTSTIPISQCDTIVNSNTPIDEFCQNVIVNVKIVIL